MIKKLFFISLIFILAFSTLALAENLEGIEEYTYLEIDGEIITPPPEADPVVETQKTLDDIYIVNSNILTVLSVFIIFIVLIAVYKFFRIFF